MSVVEKKNRNKLPTKIVMALFIVLFTNIFFIEYSYAHNSLIIGAILGTALIVIGGVHYIISTIILALLVKGVHSERYKKVLFILILVLIDFLVYAVLSGIAYIFIGIIGRLTFDINQGVQNGIILSLLMLLAGLSTFLVFRLNTLVANTLLKEEKRKKLLRINLIASILYNPIIVLGLIWLVLFLVSLVRG